MVTNWLKLESATVVGLDVDEENYFKIVVSW